MREVNLEPGWLLKECREAAMLLRLRSAAPRLLSLLKRYRTETPLGSYYRLACEVDDLIAEIEKITLE